MSFKAIMNDLKKELMDTRKDVRARFIAGAYSIHGGIIRLWYTGRKGDQGLGRRTGSAAKSWSVVKTESPSGVQVAIVSAGVPHADASNRTVIKSNRPGGWLAIPTAQGVTSRGVPRYQGPRDAEQKLNGPSGKSKLAFIRKDRDTMLVMARKGVTGTGLSKNRRLLFVLKKSVVRPAYTSGMFPWVDSQAKKMEGALLK